MNYKTKKKKVLDATKKYSANKIHPSSKGSVISKLKKGKHLKEETLDKILENIELLEKKSTDRKKKPTKPSKQTVKKDINLKQEDTSLKEEIQKLKEENERLKQKNTQLKEEIEELKIDNEIKIDNTEYTENTIIAGFRLKRENTTTTTYRSDSSSYNKVYQKCYAKKMIKGKQCKVYLGNSFNKSTVDNKIKAYMDKHNIVIY